MFWHFWVYPVAIPAEAAMVAPVLHGGCHDFLIALTHPEAIWQQHLGWPWATKGHWFAKRTVLATLTHVGLGKYMIYMIYIYIVLFHIIYIILMLESENHYPNISSKYLSLSTVLNLCLFRPTCRQAWASWKMVPLQPEIHRRCSKAPIDTSTGDGRTRREDQFQHRLVLGRHGSTVHV